MNTIKYLYHTIYLWFNPRKHKAKILSTLPRSRKHWSVEEIEDLIFMHIQHASLEFIAEELDRPIAGVRSKLISLGYSTKGKN